MGNNWNPLPLDRSSYGPMFPTSSAQHSACLTGEHCQPLPVERISDGATFYVPEETRRANLKRAMIIAWFRPSSTGQTLLRLLPTSQPAGVLDRGVCHKNGLELSRGIPRGLPLSHPGRTLHIAPNGSLKAISSVITSVPCTSRTGSTSERRDDRRVARSRTPSRRPSPL
jgi:hypothetical protein